jgi:tetrapyrrole methylase family protein / MazG family protein
LSDPQTTPDVLRAKAEAFRALEEIIERLRSPTGCPWDRAQTIEKMAPNILEEACETVDAIREGGGAPSPEVLEELGDVLMNVLLAARIAEEAGAFGIREVAEAISAKLIRRHPHVFGDERAAGVEDVLRRWNAIKAEEKKGSEGQESRLGKIPRSLPALSAAVKIGERAGAVGFDWPDAKSAFGKVEEEVREVAEALGDADGPSKPGDELEHEVGDLLFAVANLARKAGIDPESALRSALGRFRKRFRHIEERIDVTRASLAEMEALWQAAKEVDG